MTYQRIRHIERSRDDYSAWAMVEELRMEARAYWQNMHEYRRRQAAATTQDDRHTFYLCEQHARRQLAFALKILNAGLERDGSYANAERRAYWRGREAAA